MFEVRIFDLVAAEEVEAEVAEVAVVVEDATGEGPSSPTAPSSPNSPMSAMATCSSSLLSAGVGGGEKGATVGVVVVVAGGVVTGVEGGGVVGKAAGDVGEGTVGDTGVTVAEEGEGTCSLGDAAACGVLDVSNEVVSVVGSDCCVDTKGGESSR